MDARSKPSGQAISGNQITELTTVFLELHLSKTRYPAEFSRCMRQVCGNLKQRCIGEYDVSGHVVCNSQLSAQVLELLKKFFLVERMLLTLLVYGRQDSFF